MWFFLLFKMWLLEKIKLYDVALISLFIFLKDFIYLFLERRAGREKERERETLINCLSHALKLGPGLEPRYVP